MIFYVNFQFRKHDFSTTEGSHFREREREEYIDTLGLLLFRPREQIHS
jgi:hypothetical protein